MGKQNKKLSHCIFLDPLMYCSAVHQSSDSLAVGPKSCGSRWGNGDLDSAVVHLSAGER